MLVLRLVAAVMTAVSALALVTSEPLPDPLYGEDFPDPVVVRSGAFWYAFATNGMGGNVQVIRSLDLRTWTRRPDALPNLPPWAARGSTWAPAVVEWGGRWLLFFTAKHRTSGLQCIGRAVSSSGIDGPFSDSSAQPFVCQMDRGGSIDPAVFVDGPAAGGSGGGAAYLLFKSEGVEGREPTRLWAQRLSPDGSSLDGSGGGPVQLAVTDQAWEEPIVEGPAMVAGGGWYWLLYAGNRWETSSYAIGHARCASPLGPCTKWGGGPVVASGAGGSFAGPGAPDTVAGPEGELLLTFHAWSVDKVGYGSAGGRRALRALPLRFEAGRMLVGAQVAPRADGYRLVAADGGVFAFGADGFHGSTGDLRLNRPVVSGAATPSDAGYWFVASDGGVFAFGDAGFFGSTGAVRLNKPIVGMAATATGRGYWLVASDGGVFAFGDAAHYGSTGSTPLNSPITGVAAAPWGDGYWMVAADGGVFAFGPGAPFVGSAGSVPLRSPIVGLAATPSGGGYWLTAADGGVFAFGDAAFFGSTGDRSLNSPVVAMT